MCNLFPFSLVMAFALSEGIVEKIIGIQGKKYERTGIEIRL